MELITSTRVTVTMDTKPLFHPGTVECMPEALALLGGGETVEEIKERSAEVDKKITELVCRHITGDFGLVPVENAGKNRERIAKNGDMVMSFYPLSGDRTEPFKMDDTIPNNAVYLLTLVFNNEPRTFVASNAEIGILFMTRKLMFMAVDDRVQTKPEDGDGAPVVDLRHMTPAGHA